MSRLITLFLVFFAVPSLAHIPGLKDTDELYKWADRQHNDLGHGCCGEGDALVLEEDQVRIRNSDYEVQINGHWVRISPWMRLQGALSDPNPSGHAVVWYHLDTTKPDNISVKCFAPPTMD